MRLIFIRHGDPDYKKDNLTEKGKREVKLLTKRICNWKDITAFYTSPLGRAKATGEPSLKKLKREAKEYPWLKEFYYRTNFPANCSIAELSGKDTMCWDLIPDYFYSNPDFFHKDNWKNTDFMEGGNIKQKYQEVCDGIDSVLKEYGYIRNEMGFYNVENPKPNHNWNEPVNKYQLKSVKDDYPQETTLVFFCHLGVMFAIISHLIGMSPMQLWQGFYVPPTSITILNTEERKKGQADFRVERLGDTYHLKKGKEPISSSGYFAGVFPY